jgi:hypothetical protein
MGNLASPNYRTLFEEAPGLFLVLDPGLTIRAVGAISPSLTLPHKTKNNLSTHAVFRD